MARADLHILKSACGGGRGGTAGRGKRDASSSPDYRPKMIDDAADAADADDTASVSDRDTDHLLPLLLQRQGSDCDSDSRSDGAVVFVDDEEEGFDGECVGEGEVVGGQQAERPRQQQQQQPPSQRSGHLLSPSTLLHTPSSKSGRMNRKSSGDICPNPNNGINKKRDNVTVLPPPPLSPPGGDNAFLVSSQSPATTATTAATTKGGASFDDDDDDESRSSSSNGSNSSNGSSCTTTTATPAEDGAKSVVPSVPSSGSTLSVSASSVDGDGDGDGDNGTTKATTDKPDTTQTKAEVVGPATATSPSLPHAADGNVLAGAILVLADGAVSATTTIAAAAAAVVSPSLASVGSSHGSTSQTTATTVERRNNASSSKKEAIGQRRNDGSGGSTAAAATAAATATTTTTTTTLAPSTLSSLLMASSGSLRNRAKGTGTGTAGGAGRRRHHVSRKDRTIRKALFSQQNQQRDDAVVAMESGSSSVPDNDDSNDDDDDDEDDDDEGYDSFSDVSSLTSMGTMTNHSSFMLEYNPKVYLPLMMMGAARGRAANAADEGNSLFDPTVTSGATGFSRNSSLSQRKRAKMIRTVRAAVRFSVHVRRNYRRGSNNRVYLPVQEEGLDETSTTTDQDSRNREMPSVESNQSDQDRSRAAPWPLSEPLQLHSHQLQQQQKPRASCPAVTDQSHVVIMLMDPRQCLFEFVSMDCSMTAENTLTTAIIPPGGSPSSKSATTTTTAITVAEVLARLPTKTVSDFRLRFQRYVGFTHFGGKGLFDGDVIDVQRLARDEAAATAVPAAIVAPSVLLPVESISIVTPVRAAQFCGGGGIDPVPDPSPCNSLSERGDDGRKSEQSEYLQPPLLVAIPLHYTAPQMDIFAKALLENPEVLESLQDMRAEVLESLQDTGLIWI